jgi:hypothetical protein
MTKKEKAIKFMASEKFNKIMMWYSFIVGSLILVTAKNNFDYGLVFFNYLMVIIMYLSGKNLQKSNASLQRLLNYISIYKTLPPEILKEKEKDLYNIERKIVKKEFECLYNKHDVVCYCSTNPGTKLTKYFEQHIEKLNFCFFKNKFIVIDPNNLDLFVFKEKF